MSDNPLIKKLLIKPGYRMIIVRPPAGYIANLKPLPPEAAISDKLDGIFDFAQVFIKTLKEVDEIIPDVLKTLREDGILWVCYPKGTVKIATDVNRDILWKHMAKYGLTGVAMVSIDDTWSAMRFRPLDKVGK